MVYYNIIAQAGYKVHVTLFAQKGTRIHINRSERILKDFSINIKPIFMKFCEVIFFRKYFRS